MAPVRVRRSRKASTSERLMRSPMRVQNLLAFGFAGLDPVAYPRKDEGFSQKGRMDEDNGCRALTKAAGALTERFLQGRIRR